MPARQKKTGTWIVNTTIVPDHRQLKNVHNCLLEDFLFFAKADILKIFSISTLAKKENLLKDSYKQSSAACVLIQLN